MKSYYRKKKYSTVCSSSLILCILPLLFWCSALFGQTLNLNPEKHDEPVTPLFMATKQHDSLLIVTITLSMKKSVHIYSSESNFFTIEITDTTGLSYPKLQLPSPTLYKNFDGTSVFVFTDGQVITASFTIQTPDHWSVNGSIGFQACDSTKCFLPTKKQFSFSSKTTDTRAQESTNTAVDSRTQTNDDRQNTDSIHSLLRHFSIEGKTEGYKTVREFIQFIQNPSTANDLLFAGKNIVVIIFLTLLGGLLLNFTPCVLPMIPITIAVIGAGSHAKSKLQGLISGTFYGLGMALAYGGLGIAVVLTGIKFGIINSSWIFNLLIGILFVVLAFAMFDVLHIDFTQFRGSLTIGSKAKGNFILTFIMGAVAAILAGACVAPVVISVILYSSSVYAKGQFIGLLLPFVLGLGMALPWPLAGAGLAFLPKPGAWMVWVRNIFGVVILAIAGMYLFTAFKIGVINKMPTPQKTHPSKTLVWETALEPAVTRALSEKKRILIDFTASWCKSCTVMEATTLVQPEIEELLKDLVLIKCDVDAVNDPYLKQAQSYFKVIGLPTYIILKPLDASQSQ